MKHLIIAFLLFNTSYFSFAQNRVLTDNELNNSSITKITFLTDCKNDISALWQDDYNKKHVFLFLQGGIAPISYSKDKDFEEEFGIYFYDDGDVVSNYECITKYNEITFDYLYKTYGKIWLKKVRGDVFGLKNWKRKRK